MSSMGLFSDDQLHQLHIDACRGVRKIRSVTQITSREISGILEGGKELDTSTVDGICAALQAKAEKDEGSPHWAVFSLWLGPLVKGIVKEGSFSGSIEQHIRHAVPDGSAASLSARTLWAIPLCSFKPPHHWVLAWIDWGQSQIGIYDSLPQLGSSVWAEPLLLKIIDRVLQLLQKEPAVWDEGNWQHVLQGPPPLRIQMDTWSCGLFVAMKVDAIARGLKNSEILGNDGLDEMRKNAVNLLLKLPIVQYTKYSTGNEDSDNPDDGVWVEEGVLVLMDKQEARDPTMSLNDDTVVDSGFEREHDTVSSKYMPGGWRDDASMIGVDEERDMDVVMGGVSQDDDGGESKKVDVPVSDESRKRALSIPNSTEATGAVESGTSKNKKPRGAKRPVEERKKMLEDDMWIEEGSVTSTSVKCKGCKKTLILDRRPAHPYELKLHQAKCSVIIGEKKVRIKVVKPTILATNAITGFFQRKLKSDAGIKAGTQDASHLEVLIPTTSSAPTVTAPRVEHQPLNKACYLTKTVKLEKLPSIAAFLKPAQVDPLKKNSVVPLVQVPCKHLYGPEYDAYINLTETRDFGGISFLFIAEASRILFPYKSFPSIKHSFKLSNSILANLQPHSLVGVPDDGNSASKMDHWTGTERKILEQHLKPWARWQVNYSMSHIQSTRCQLTTANSNGICNECWYIRKDEGLLRSIRRKNEEDKLPAEQQRALLKQRGAHRHTNLIGNIQDSSFRDKLQDPMLFDFQKSLRMGGPEDCFLTLMKHARDGHLRSYERFREVCKVVVNRITRETSENKNLKYGIRYPESFLNFMIAMRGYGQNSNRQYEIFAAEFAGPSVRHLRSLVANSSDTLQNPYLIPENVARMKRYVDLIGYKGPIVIGSDCTKVKKCLNFSTQHGCHVLGTVFDLSAVEVDNADDIDEIVDWTVKQKAFVTQARAILAKIPAAHCPPIVIAILPTNGSETAADIHGHHLTLQKMASNFNLSVIGFSADGAASELAAQALMDCEETGLPPLEYSCPLYGYHVKAPVFPVTGPMILFTDPPHAKKTARNQPQYGTHTASLGSGHLVNRNLVDLSDLPSSGLVFRDVHNVDKQDDGAARRLFHTQALEAMLEKVDGEESIRPGFEGLFIYLFILGCLFEAWMSPDMSISKRILAATRARFWLHYCHRHVSCRSISQSLFINKPSPSFTLTYRSALASSRPSSLNTSLVLLVSFCQTSRLLKTKRERDSASGYIYSPDTDMHKSSKVAPLTITLSKDELDHLIKLGHDEAAQICHDILHIPMPRFSAQKPVTLIPLGAWKVSNIGKDTMLDDEDSEYASDVNDEHDSDEEPPQRLHEEVAIPLSKAAEEASEAVAAFEAFASTFEPEDDSALKQLLEQGHFDIAIPIATDSGVVVPHANTCGDDEQAPEFISSRILSEADSLGLAPIRSRVSIVKIMESRSCIQSGTTTKSERIVKISSKYVNLEKQQSKGDSKINKPKFTPQEASHRLRIAQEVNQELKKDVEKKTRQLRWQNAIKEVKDAVISGSRDDASNVAGRGKLKWKGGVSPVALPYLEQKNITSLNPIRRMYIGHVLDLYKKGDNSRYGSISEASNIKDIAWLSLRVYLPIQNGNNSDDDDMMDEPDSSLLDFSCGYKTYKCHLHTHAPSDHIVYNLGSSVFEFHDGNILRARLSQAAGKHWNDINQSLVKAALAKLPPLKIHIPGGRMGYPKYK
ncbi:hypothetical protein BJ165DRAFT_1534007 [Panaeolus papilionaceus]|nr:hypothetical protein BJ165DRAFT_1534007 [Panaeolus papilionaceus]